MLGIGPRLQAVDPEVVADKKSLFRIYRDTRFSADKTPYKTHAAAQFQRGATRGPSGTGYYLHLEPANCFFVGGTWMPEPAVAARIRAAIDAHQPAWVAARDAAGGLYAGETLARVPKPFPADHPLAEDLRRKSFTAWQRFSEDDVVAADFGDRVVAATARLAPLVRFLSDVVG